jgi:hypothetical protein
MFIGIGVLVGFLANNTSRWLAIPGLAEQDHASN